MSKTRREFLVQAVGTVAVARALIACGGDDGPGRLPGPNIDAAPTPPPPGDAPRAPDAPPEPTSACIQNGTTSTIVANHGHIVMVSAADVAAGVERTYDITGTAGHPHLVTVTAAMFAMLEAEQAISVESTLGGDAQFPTHLHPVTVMCA